MLWILNVDQSLVEVMNNISSDLHVGTFIFRQFDIIVSVFSNNECIDRL